MVFEIGFVKSHSRALLLKFAHPILKEVSHESLAFKIPTPRALAPDLRFTFSIFLGHKCLRGLHFQLFKVTGSESSGGQPISLVVRQSASQVISQVVTYY